MPLIIPYVPPAPPPSVSATVVAPNLRITFYTDTGGTDITTVKTFQSSLGRMSPRTDGTAAGTASLLAVDTKRVLDPDNTSSPLYGKLTPGGTTTVQVTCWDGTRWVELFTGLIEQIDTTWPGGTTYSEANIQLVDQQRDLNLAIPPLGKTFPAQKTGQRIGQLLGAPSRTAWGWLNRARNGAFALDKGQKQLAPLVCDGTTSAWSSIADTAATEKGLAFFDQAGIPTFHDQAHRYRSSTPVWVFGDNPGEIMLDPSLGLSLPNDRTLTDVAYTSADGVTAAYGKNGLTYTWTDTDSQGNTIIFTEHDGTITATVQTDSTPQVTGDTVLLADKYQAGARARWEYNTYSVNRRDAPQLVINSYGEWPSVTSPSRFACALYAKISDYCELNRRPGNGPTITKHYWIDGIAHDIQAGDHWQTTFTTVQADPIKPLWKVGTTKLADVTYMQW